ncbi:MAG: hypothetical protein EWV76_18290 [Microcystis novacekii Mn_MB_F_20050700_S1]|uniref:Uncharacterized protein n=1 Tax=Microcystis novacekii Mn_MB_F_20050700_S1D TaxID=2486266 RepID=A0A552J1X8_9CHRO|nr:MAG: hypothetical protein EWV76_18290 [Microcystis novacekii Mn_MB_F_20050700_S1]TRU89759.1 MAG: hypothetical protein EWV54_08065 [Microcystis novacekii Mn_MB_F_20050700_S1D]
MIVKGNYSIHLTLNRCHYQLSVISYQLLDVSVQFTDYCLLCTENTSHSPLPQTPTPNLQCISNTCIFTVLEIMPNSC